jgi:hypothetical protein
MYLLLIQFKSAAEHCVASVFSISLIKILMPNVDDESINCVTVVIQEWENTLSHCSGVTVSLTDLIIRLYLKYILSLLPHSSCHSTNILNSIVEFYFISGRFWVQCSAYRPDILRLFVVFLSPSR